MGPKFGVEWRDGWMDEIIAVRYFIPLCCFCLFFSAHRASYTALRREKVLVLKLFGGVGWWADTYASLHKKNSGYFFLLSTCFVFWILLCTRRWKWEDRQFWGERHRKMGTFILERLHSFVFQGGCCPLRTCVLLHFSFLEREKTDEALRACFLVHLFLCRHHRTEMEWCFFVSWTASATIRFMSNRPTSIDFWVLWSTASCFASLAIITSSVSTKHLSLLDQ